MCLPTLSQPLLLTKCLDVNLIPIFPKYDFNMVSYKLITDAICL